MRRHESHPEPYSETVPTSYEQLITKASWRLRTPLAILATDCLNSYRFIEILIGPFLADTIKSERRHLTGPGMAHALETSKDGLGSVVSITTLDVAIDERGKGRTTDL